MRWLGAREGMRWLGARAGMRWLALFFVQVSQYHHNTCDVVVPIKSSCSCNSKRCVKFGSGCLLQDFSSVTIFADTADLL